MKIVFVSSAQIPSDTANSIQVMKVCQAFTQLGHKVLLLLPDLLQDGFLKTDLLKHYGLQWSIDIERLAAGNRRWFPWKAVCQARRHGAELLYAWPLQAASLGLVAGLPVMLEIHDLPAGRFGRQWLNLFLRIPGRKRLLPITRALKERLHLPDRQTVVSPDGVDLERYDHLPQPTAARKSLGLPQAPTVLCTGHLYEGRGADLFLGLAGKFPGASFIWVGGRPVEVEAWRSRARQQSLTNVLFTGFVPNEIIPLYQAAAEVLLMPYQLSVATSGGGNTAEVCSPMKMFEYMAAGRAILSSNLPVLREVLDDSMAVFCPQDEPGAWQSALESLLKDEKRRKALGQQARAAVMQYSWIERARRSLDGFNG